MSTLPCKDHIDTVSECDEYKIHRNKDNIAHQKMRLNRTTSGLCITCGKNDAETGYTTCDICIVKHRVDHGVINSAVSRCTLCNKMLRANYVNKTCTECLIRSKNSHKLLKLDRKQKGLCIQCGIKKPYMRPGNNRYLYVRCKLCLDYQNNIKAKNSSRYAAGVKEYRNKVKLTIYKAYGNKCACCDITEIEFLTIDHINNDGAMHRRSLLRNGRQIGGNEFYKWIIDNKFPDALQLLCANCHLSKTKCGICIHKRKV